MRLLRLSQQQKLGCLAVSPSPAPRPSPSPRPASGLSEIELDLADQKLVESLDRQGDHVQIEDLERPQSRGLTLGFDAKQRFYGPAAGAQVEEELRRLGALVQGLLKDFALVKDSVWHLQDERDSAWRRVDSLELGSLATLRAQSTDSAARLEELQNRAELTDVRVKAAEEEQERLNSLLGRVELLDSRLAAAEMAGFAHASAARRPRSAAGYGSRALSPLAGAGVEAAAAGVAASGVASSTKDPRPMSVASEVLTEDSEAGSQQRVRSGFGSEGAGVRRSLSLKEEEGSESPGAPASDAGFSARMDAVHDMYLAIEQDAARELARVLVEETEPGTQSSSCTGSRSVSPVDGPLVAEKPVPAALDASFGDRPEPTAPRVSPGHRLRGDGKTSKGSVTSSCEGQRRSHAEEDAEDL